jgi:hypothetical protein
MTPTAFLELSTRLCKDMKDWTEEMFREEKLSPDHLQSLKDALGVIEQVTLEATAAAMPPLLEPPVE